MTVGAIFGGAGSALFGARLAGCEPVWLIEPRPFVDPMGIVVNFVGVVGFGGALHHFRDQYVDVIVGSPSCSQFSPLGMKRKDRGKLGDLNPDEFEIVMFLNEVKLRKPKYFILENVPQMLRHFILGFNSSLHSKDHGGKIVASLPDYFIAFFAINTLDLWPYQTRNRIYFVGSRLDETQFTDLPIKKLEPKGCSEILDDLPNEDVAALDHYIPNQSSERTERMAKLEYGQSYYGTQNNRRLDPNKPAYTITSHCTRHIHYKYPRTLTVRECARLQGFPDNFRFFGTETSRLDQVGKAISPPVAQLIFKKLREINGL